MGGKTAKTDLSQAKTKARIMQDKKYLKTNIQPRGRGRKVRWVPCVKVEKNRGRQRIVRSDAHCTLSEER